MAFSNNTLRRAEKILGYDISTTAGARTYPVIDGVVYADLYSGGTIPDGSTKAFNGHINGLTYFNEVLIDDCHEKTVTLTLTWGSAEFNADIDDLLQWLEDNPSIDLLDEASIKSKKIEDFSVTLNTSDETQSSTQDAISAGYSYYIRSPIIIGISGEQRDDWRYF